MSVKIYQTQLSSFWSTIVYRETTNLLQVSDYFYDLKMWRIVSEWLLFNANSAIFQLYYG